MAKPAHFKAYDLRRKNLRTIASPPVKIHQPRLVRGEWMQVSKANGAGVAKFGRVGRKNCRFSKRSLWKRLPQTAMAVLSCAGSSEIECLHCGKLADDPSCGPRCYREFRKQHVIADQIDIKGPGPLGYGAFTKPGVYIEKGQYLDEYIGELRPIVSENDDGTSLYRFEIPATCVVDAQRAGNWTRFINSHCQPNCKPYGDFVGKRHVIIFQAIRDIGPEEEIVFDYGKKYFEKAGFNCKCDAHKGSHMPGQKGTSAKMLRSRR